MTVPAVDFGLIRYANCWEDAEVLAAGLRPAPGKRILSIASGLDNSLWLAAAGAEVVACDLSPAQLALGELKLAALRRLDHDALLGFLGVRAAADRLAVYRRLSGELSPSAQAFWTRHPAALRRGVLHTGRFERYFALFRRLVLPLVHSRRTVEGLLRCRDAAHRRRYYDRRWDSLRWQLLFRIFFSRRLMGALGRDPAFFAEVDGPVATAILERAEAALTGDLPRNHFLHYILLGNWRMVLPPWLRREHFPAMRDAAERITLVQGAIDAVAAADDRGFDGFNCSDIFEYLPLPVCDTVYGALLAAARPQARWVYWNMQVPRRMAERFSDRVGARDDLAAELRRRDLGFFYRALVVEERVS